MMITLGEMRELALFQPGSELVVSFYLNTDRRDRSPLRCAEVAHQLVREATAHCEDPALPPTITRRLQADLDRITQYVGAEFADIAADRERGLAIFRCGARGLWRVFGLSSPVADLVRVEPMPYLRPLAEAVAGFPRAGVVLVDRKGARLFVIEMDAIRELDPIADDVPGRVKPGSRYGMSDSKIERYVDEQIERHLKHVSAAVDKMARSENLDRMLIGGAPDVVPALVRELSCEMQDRLAGRIEPLMMIATPDEVLASAREALSNVVERERADLVLEITESVGPGCRAAVGIDDTLLAIYRKSIRTLALERRTEAAGWRCSVCCRLYRAPGPCPECGGQAECVCDLAEAALEEALRQGAGFAFVDNACMLNPWDGMAALLRFPVGSRGAEPAGALAQLV